MADFTIVTSNAQGPQGPPGNSSPIFITFHTFGYAGEVLLPVGTSDFLPPFFVMKMGNQALSLTRARFVLNGGTSATVKLQRNGVDIPGWTNITVNQVAASLSPAPVTLNDNDRINMIVTAVTGNPQNLTFTIGIQHNIT